MANETTSKQTYVSNAFGTATNKWAVYFRAKGWFSGGSREDVPLKHVTSVRINTKRHPVVGIVLGLVGLAMLGSGEAGVVIGGVVLIVLAGLLLLGSPSVIVNTAGGDLSAARGFPPMATERSECLRRSFT
jgi:hypothetical protein